MTKRKQSGVMDVPARHRPPMADLLKLLEDRAQKVQDKAGGESKLSWEEAIVKAMGEMREEGRKRTQTKAWPDGAPREGWHWLFNSSRSHFFRENGRSLCGKWMTFSRDRNSEPQVNPPCANCKKLVPTHKPVKRK